MLKKILWHSILILSLGGLLVLSVGFYQALRVSGPAPKGNGITAAPEKPQAGPIERKVKNPNAIHLLIMGDSIARGTGDETGRGFSVYLPEYLKNQTPKEMVVNNDGIDGLQSDQLLTLLQSGQLKSALVDSDIVLLSIGGNDLRHIRRRDVTAIDDAFQVAFAAYQNNLKSIVALIRKENADALLVFVGLYNPLAQENSQEDARFLLFWNQGTENILDGGKGAVFIPTYDLFKLNTAKYIALDALHPNAAGYQAIANRIGRSIEGYFNGGSRSEK